MINSFSVGLRIVFAVVLLAGARQAAGAPNLTAYQPSGWSDRIVVARTGGTTTDSTLLQPSDTLFVNWAVINNGTSTTTNAFAVNLYVDGSLRTFWNSGGALPSSTYLFVTNYSIGSLSSGSHTIMITADPANAVTESNEGDNSYTKTITVGTPPLPDLARFSDSMTNLSPRAGDAVAVSLTMTNQSCVSGNTNATAFHVGFYLSTNSSFSGAVAFTEAAVAGCAVNGTVSLNQNVTISSATAVGTYYLGYKIDDENEVTECTENNNGIFYWTLTVSASADLTPQSVTVNPNPAVTNGSVNVSYTVANLGGAAAAASHTKVQILDAGDNVLTQQTFSTVGLAAYASTNESRSLSLSGSVPGTYHAIVTVDANHEVAQGSNTNNDASAATSFTVLAHSGLVIIPIFDSSITSDPQAATIEATINSAITAYETNFADPVTVTVEFQEMGSGLGQSSWYYHTFTYSAYRAALAAHATTADDTTALAFLPNSANNPVNGNTSVNVHYALARALGFSEDPPPGEPDGTIYLNTAIMNLSAAQTNQSKYSLFATVAHEMDEVLGLGSALDDVAEGSETASGPIFVEDLFRYDGGGARSYTTNVNATSYFSLNGSTDLAQFNQAASGDFGDWYSVHGGQIPQVQDAFATQGATPVLGVELRALDAVGFTYLPPKTNQTITFGALTNRSLGELPFTVSATASSGLTVSFSILSGPATISSNVVTLTGTGTVTVRASQNGNGNYNAAPNVDQSFTVFAVPSISLSTTGGKLVLLWPTNVAGYEIDRSTNLVNWIQVAAGGTVVNGQYAYTNTATNGSVFYRLKK